jgi:zinc D-Ala-D-Ala carboxypeptidase
LNNPGFSGKSQDSEANSNANTGEDIPAAFRDTPELAPKGKKRPLMLGMFGVGGFVLLAVISGFLFFLAVPKKSADAPTAVTAPQPNASVNPQNNSDVILGHLAYPEAPETELVSISADGRTKMRSAAAEKFQAMVQAARSAGVSLVPLSAFRSIKDQEKLFFDVGAQRNQTPAERAALSAPPGHSEHHTGYAVDIGDGAAPGTNVIETFDTTKAYQWLQANAARFSFEMSFPKDNVQGVSYEPWHWRFVGDRDSLETFYKAKNLKPVQPKQ